MPKNICKLKVKVRPMKPRDFDGVISNYFGAYDEAERNPWIGIYLYSPKPSIKEEKKWFTETLQKAKQNDGFAIVAEVDGKIMGATDVTTKTAAGSKARRYGWFTGPRRLQIHGCWHCLVDGAD